MCRSPMLHFRRNTARSSDGRSAAARRTGLSPVIPRSLGISAAVILAAVVLAPAAGAADVLQQAAQHLEGNPVYVAPNATEKVDAGRIRREIAAAHPGAMYVAVLPDVGGDPDQALRTLIDDLHRDGTYALIEGNHFRAASNTVPRSGELASEAID